MQNIQTIQNHLNPNNVLWFCFIVYAFSEREFDTGMYILNWNQENKVQFDHLKLRFIID